MNMLNPPRRKRFKAPVTIIVAIKCVNGIIVASDSRTIDESGRIHDDAQKLHEIEASDGNSAILAEAGNAEQSARAQEILKNYLQAKTLNDYRAITDCAERAMSDLKNFHRQQYKGAAEELQRRFHEYDFSWFLAFYYEKRP